MTLFCIRFFEVVKTYCGVFVHRPLLLAIILFGILIVDSDDWIYNFIDCTCALTNFDGVVTFLIPFLSYPRPTLSFTKMCRTNSQLPDSFLDMLHFSYSPSNCFSFLLTVWISFVAITELSFSTYSIMARRVIFLSCLTFRLCFIILYSVHTLLVPVESAFSRF